MLENGENCLGNSNEISHCVPKFCNYKNIFLVWWGSSFKISILTVTPWQKG